MTRIELYEDFLTMLSTEAKQIATALNQDTSFNSEYKAVTSGGIKSKINDRRLYRWIDIKGKNTNETLFFITMYYNEITPDTSNFHTQFGRLQFYKGANVLHKYEGKSQNAVATQGMLKVDFSNAFNPKISIFDDDYEVSQVVQSFIGFYNSNNN